MIMTQSSCNMGHLPSTEQLYQIWRPCQVEGLVGQKIEWTAPSPGDTCGFLLLGWTRDRSHASKPTTIESLMSFTELLVLASVPKSSWFCPQVDREMYWNGWLSVWIFAMNYILSSCASKEKFLVSGGLSSSVLYSHSCMTNDKLIRSYVCRTYHLTFYLSFLSNEW